ncbi:hypothetical protein IWW55_004825, partial [Coemansia sp. RSA 2706]
MEDYDSDLELTIVGEPSTSLAQQRHQDLSRELADIDRQLAALQRRRAAVVQRMENAQAEIDNSARLEQKKRNEKLKDTYDSIGFRWSTQACSLLKSVFKLQGFRDNQEAIINATLDGRDVVVIMPTGGGKSLCYQLPALISPGLTVVISPLIALMDDQVMQLKELGISAEALTSESKNPNEIKDMLRSMAGDLKKRRRVDLDNTADDGAGILKLLYVSPEKIVAGKQL